MDYKLVLKEYQAGFEVIFTGDFDDGDMVTTHRIYSKDVFDNTVLSLLKDLKDNYMNYGDLIRYNDEDKNNDYVLNLPYSYQTICHSLESIEVIYYSEDGKIYDVIL